MESERLDALINSLDSLIDNTKSDTSDERAYRGWQFFVHSYRHDWRPVWALCNEIQDGFSDVRYIRAAQRQESWLRFCHLRNDASRAANVEREDFQTASLTWRRRFIDEADALDYSRATDQFFAGIFFPPATVEDMKKLSLKLKELVSEIHDNRRNLSRARFDECLLKTREIRDRQNTFWERYRNQLVERREQFIQRQKERISKIEANIDDNQERLKRCEDALERTETTIESLKAKILEAWSDTWREQHRKWLVEAVAKRESILETRDRLRAWIEQGNSELHELHRRIE